MPAPVGRGQGEERVATKAARRLLRLAICGFAVVAALGFASSALAAGFQVTNNLDESAGSLRQAILDANADPGPDTITFDLPVGLGTIKPNSNLPAIMHPVVIDGTGSTSPPVLDGSL